LQRPGYYQSIAFDAGDGEPILSSEDGDEEVYDFCHDEELCVRITLDEEGRGTLVPASGNTDGWHDLPNADIQLETFRRCEEYNLSTGECRVDRFWDYRVNYWSLDKNTPQERAANRAAAAAAKAAWEAAKEAACRVRPRFGQAYIPANIPDYQERMEQFYCSPEHREEERCCAVYHQLVLRTPEGKSDDWRPGTGMRTWYFELAKPGQKMRVLREGSAEVTTQDGDLVISLHDSRGEGGAWLMRHHEP